MINGDGLDELTLGCMSFILEKPSSTDIFNGVNSCSINIVQFYCICHIVFLIPTHGHIVFTVWYVAANDL